MCFSVPGKAENRPFIGDGTTERPVWEFSLPPQLPAWAAPAPGALRAAAAVGRGKMPLGCEPGGPGLLCLPQGTFILRLFREDILCHGAVAHVWRALSFLFLPCSVQSTLWLRCRVSKLRPFPEGNDSTHTPQAVKVISKEQLRADQTAFGMKIGL